MGNSAFLKSQITVLIPSRGRPDQLVEAVHSLRFTAYAPSQLDIRIGADSDDLQTIGVARSMGIQVAVFQERHGYAQIWKYFNGLIPDVYVGEWTLLFNDDARMKTLGWDDELRELSYKFLVADFRNHHSPGLVTFPAVRERALRYFDYRFVPEKLETPHVDSVWQELGRRSGTMSPTLDSYIEHLRPDIADVPEDNTYREGRTGLDHARFFSQPYQDELNRAANYIMSEECAQ